MSSASLRNLKFKNAVERRPQAIPPIWMMRQAGRYHRHYQALRAKHSFVDLCKVPELAAEVALGPVQDFDFDVSILFSDLLFILEALGQGLEYTDKGPKLAWQLDETSLSRLAPLDEALPKLHFQKEALLRTRQVLPADKSLIGFVGGPWTLFSYAVEGSHAGAMVKSKRALHLFNRFCEILVPLLIQNIRLQFEGGAEVVMVFDTAAGELSPAVFTSLVVPQLERLARAYPGRLGYYSRGTQAAHLRAPLFSANLFAGLGVDHRWEMAPLLRGGIAGTKPVADAGGFVQGNFDQALLHCDADTFRRELKRWIDPLRALTPEQRAGWVCGLGHGVLPATPEENVRAFVQIVREAFA